MFCACIEYICGLIIEWDDIATCRQIYHHINFFFSHSSWYKEILLCALYHMNSYDMFILPEKMRNLNSTTIILIMWLIWHSEIKNYNFSSSYFEISEHLKIFFFPHHGLEFPYIYYCWCLFLIKGLRKHSRSTKWLALKLNLLLLGYLPLNRLSNISFILKVCNKTCMYFPTNSHHLSTMITNIPNGRTLLLLPPSPQQYIFQQILREVSIKLTKIQVRWPIVFIDI